MTRNRLRWPVTTIDFEASALGDQSYPIEVGVAFWAGPGTRGTSWGALIRPTREWGDTGYWNPQSQRIHGISGTDLGIHGLAPSDAMRALNAFCLPGTIAFCDGGRHDLHWMRRLADAGGIQPSLLLGSWHHLVSSLGDEVAERIAKHHGPEDIVHRAAPDAEQHIRALAFGLGLDEPGFDPATLDECGVPVSP